MITFWILWGFDAIISLVIFYFFFVGLADQTVSSFNIRIWSILLIAVLVVMLGSLWLKSADHLNIAKSLLWIMAIPGIAYTLFLLFVLIGKPRWN